MTYNKTLLKEISKINKENYKNSMEWDYVNYLDTGNLTENKIDKVQRIDLKTDKLPSRAKRIPSVKNILYSTVRPNQRHYGFINKETIPNLLISTGFVVLEIDEDKANPKYVYYYLIQDSIINMLQNIGETSTSAYPSVKVSDIENIELNLPTLSEQEAIADILSSFDNKIENNNAIIANLEEQAQTIFKSWFVDFEPFLDEGFVDSEVGLIPKGFSVVRLKEISTRRNGYSYKSKELNELSDTNMITLKNFNRNGGINFSDTKPIDETERMKEFHYLNSEDILIACTDLTQNAEVIGRTISYFENEEFDKEVYSMDLVKIEPNNIEDQMYIYYYLNSFVFKSFAEGVATGTTVLHLPKKSIDEFKMVYPSSELVNEFSNLVKPMLLKQNKLTLENKKLEEVRDALLPKLMSGEIRVGEAVESK